MVEKTLRILCAFVTLIIYKTTLPINLYAIPTCPGYSELEDLQALIHYGELTYPFVQSNALHTLLIDLLVKFLSIYLPRICGTSSIVEVLLFGNALYYILYCCILQDFFTVLFTFGFPLNLISFLSNYYNSCLSRTLLKSTYIPISKI